MKKNKIKNKAVVYLVVIMFILTFFSGIVLSKSTELIYSNTTSLTLDFGENWVNVSNMTVGVIDASVSVTAGSFIGDGSSLTNIISAISDGTVTEAKLDVNNAPTDDYSLTWDVASGKMLWKDITIGGGSGSGDFETQKIMNSNGENWTATGANIQLAINDLGDAGGQIWLPAANITVSSVINMDGNITITGCGRSTILYLADGSNCDVFDVTSESNITFENFLIDGNNFSNTDNPLIDIQSAGAGGVATKYITVKNMIFLNCGTSMVDVHYDDNSWYLLVDSCRFNGIERDTGLYPAGIWFSGFNAILKNNWIENTFGSGIVIEAASAEPMASNIVIDGNFVTGYTGYGILAEGGGDTANITCVNNHVWNLNSSSYWSPESSYSTGIRITGNSTIANNWVHNVYRYGIYAEGHNTIVTGNEVDHVWVKEGILIDGTSICSNNVIRNIFGNVGGAGRGIRASNEVFTDPHFIITGNYIENVDSVGIHVDAQYGTGNINHCVVSNNVIRTVVGDGITLYDVEFSSFMGNVFDDYGDLAIDEDSASDSNVFVGNVASDAGNDYDFDGSNTNYTCNIGQIA